MEYLVPVVCVHALEGCPQFRGSGLGGGGGVVSDSGVWIRGVSAIQGSGLEVCLQFRGLD